MNITGYVVVMPMSNIALTTIYSERSKAEAFKKSKDAEQPAGWPSEYKVCGLVEV